MQKNPYIHLVRAAWRHAEGRRGRTVLFYALCITANLFLLVQPFAFGKIIDLLQHPAEDLRAGLLHWCGVYFVLVLLFWALHGPARVIERRVAFLSWRHFTELYYRKVMALPLRWHQDHHSGDTINRVNKAGLALYNFAGEQFIVIQAAVRYLGGVAALAFYAPAVAVGTLLISGLAFAGSLFIDRTQLIPRYRRMNAYDHRVKAALYDYIGNIVTVITLRLQGRTAAELRQRIDVARPLHWQEVTINEVKWCLGTVLINIIQLAMLLLYVGLHWRDGEGLALGPVVAIFQYLVIINQIFIQFMMSYQNYVRWQADLQAVDGIDAGHAAQAVAEDDPDIVPPSWRLMAIEDLHFAHDPAEKRLHDLRSLALTIKAGQKIALIGASGSGKTTLLTLLRGLYAPQQVALRIDEAVHDSLRPLARLTTLIPQDAEIFENSIRYNLTLGLDVPEEALQSALKQAAFDGVAARLPQGLETDIRERGVNLSGGQKQRLALARGLIAARASSLLLLDEPTSHVDLATEGLIFDRIFASLPDKAVIASVHRLHLLPRFDWICLMQDGQMLQQGPFRELADKPGPFRDLWLAHLAQHGAETDDD